MSTETVVEKRKGNPNFFKKKEEVSEPAQKQRGPAKGMSVFKLIKSHESLKPINNVTQEMDDNPYPHIYVVENSGVAWNEEEQEQMKWKYLHGYNSIWEKYQQNPMPDANRLNNADGKNDIVFRKGFLKVPASNVSMLMALKVQDGFSGNANKLIQKPDVFELVDAEKVRKEIRTNNDKAFEAESAARRLEGSSLLGVAMALGVDVSDPDYVDEIRQDVIAKSKSNPTDFLKTWNDPRHKVKYLSTQALNQGILTIEGNVLLFKGVILFPININADVPHQISQLYLSEDKKAEELFNSLQELSL